MIDELLDEVKPKQSYDKEAYIKKKQNQLDEAYKKIENAILELKSNKDFLIDYLNVQSNLDMYTPRNALLVAKQLPNATLLKEWSKWKEQNVSFKNKYPKKILILDPKEPYTNKNGKKVVSFTAKEVIDISETNQKSTNKVYDKKMILQALLYNCPVNIKAVDELKGNKVCEWNQEENAILISRGKDSDEIIGALSKEIAEITLYNADKGIDMDKADCIAYMVCKKYGIDIGVNSADNLVKKFSDMESKNIVDELTTMKDATVEINQQINSYLELKKKEKNRSNDYER